MQGRTSVLKRGGLVLLLVVLTTAASTSTAGAVVVHLRNGQTVGVTPIKGVSSTSLPGSVARRSSATSVPNLTSDNLSWSGGPVLHGVTPYLIFWDPSGTGISSADRALYERFFADSGAASGQSTNVWAVDRQFTDSTGFADYSQAWSSVQAISDTQAYPSAGQCNESSVSGETACLFDAQIQAEVQRLITASALPDGITGQAPIYFVVTPPTVNTCCSDNSTCADNFYCAYHSSFTDSASNTALYSDIPTVLDVQDPKGCQSDGNAAVQAPNGASSATADVALKAVSHEESETITDPVDGTGWINIQQRAGGWGPVQLHRDPYDPAKTHNPNAFLPTLGGSATGSPDGTLFDQSIDSNHYYIQSEWSNGNGDCQMKPTSSAISAAFTAPSTVVAPGTSVNFDPTASTSAGGYTSDLELRRRDVIVLWFRTDLHVSLTSGPGFVDQSHPSARNDVVSLTLVDPFGNVSTVSHTVAVSNAGGPITTYTWDFGDGSAVDTTSGAQPSHTFTSPGAITSRPPRPILRSTRRCPSMARPPVPTDPASGSPASFDGSGSGEPGGTIVSYSWNFGDGTPLDTADWARRSGLPRKRSL